MLISPIQDMTLEAAALVAEKKYGEATQLLRYLLGSLSDRKAEFDTQASGLGCVRERDIVVSPVTQELRLGCPAWNDEIFSAPFAFSLRQETNQIVTEKVAAICAATSLFNMGLCWHLAGMQDGGNSATLRSACNFYSHAWTSLEKFSGKASDRDQSTAFLLMAICVNMSKCNYHLAELDASNGWMSVLRQLLQRCWLEEDSLTLEIHNYFLMASTLNTGCVAAGAA